MSFKQKLEKIVKKNNSLLCVGLDTDLEKIPQYLKNYENPIFSFNKQIVDSTHNLVCAYKPQIAYYSALGIKGMRSLLKTIEYVKTKHPEIPIILDAKRADIASTSEQYAKEVFDVFMADAVTVNPYFGLDALIPFLQRKDKGIFVIGRTTNRSANDFQDLMLNGKPLYMHVAEKVVRWNKTYNNCLMVVAATWDNELKKIRKIAPDMFFLVPGIGTQGGDLNKVLKNGLRKDKSGLILNISRAIIYSASNKEFGKSARQKAQEYKDLINKYR